MGHNVAGEFITEITDAFALLIRECVFFFLFLIAHVFFLSKLVRTVGLEPTHTRVRDSKFPRV